MIWEKCGLLFNADNRIGKEFSNYAQIPFFDILNENVWRIYYSSRTSDVISYPFSIDVEAKNPRNILRIGDKPILTLGDPGTFDDNGITVSSIVNVNDTTKYLYYIGWNRRVSVPYALNIGLAISEDNGNSFRKMFQGAIIDRNKYDPIFATAPCVMINDGLFRMWYVSCLRWDMVEGRSEPVYVIKHAFSKDGINWEINDKICIDSSYAGEALGRPWVIKENGIYKMWFSSRGSIGYRRADGQHYMITYAESVDGLQWTRKPEKCDLVLSQEGWDSEMMEYCSVLNFEGKKYMLYNGNLFGKTGFGLAVSEK